MLYYILLYYITLYSTILYYTILYYYRIEYKLVNILNFKNAKFHIIVLNVRCYQLLFGEKNKIKDLVYDCTLHFMAFESLDI